MATMHGDVTDMLAKLSPLRKVPREPDPRVIAHRWEALKPFVVIAARRSGDPAEAFAFYKKRHVEYLTKLRLALISPDVIVKHSLDDPTNPAPYFEQLLHEAVERRRARLGRVKGRVKPLHRVGKPRKSKGTK